MLVDEKGVVHSDRRRVRPGVGDVIRAPRVLRRPGRGGAPVQPPRAPEGRRSPGSPWTPRRGRSEFRPADDGATRESAARAALPRARRSSPDSSPNHAAEPTPSRSGSICACLRSASSAKTISRSRETALRAGRGLTSLNHAGHRLFDHEAHGRPPTASTPAAITVQRIQRGDELGSAR